MPDVPSQRDMFPRDLQLTRVDAARNMQRFYSMTVQPDLFGGTSLVRVWGRIGRPGRHMIEPHADEGQAINALMTLARRKMRRGYGG